MATKEKEEKKVEVEIGTIKAEVVPERTLYMTIHYGNGTLGKTKFDACFTAGAMSLVVEVEKQRYLVPMQQIISNVIEYHEQNKASA